MKFKVAPATIDWWYWMLTLLAMIAGLAGRIEGFYAVVAISAVQFVLQRHGQPPVQVAHLRSLVAHSVSHYLGRLNHLADQVPACTPIRILPVQLHRNISYPGNHESHAHLSFLRVSNAAYTENREFINAQRSA